MSKKEMDRRSTGYYASSYSKDYGRKGTDRGGSRRPRRRRSRLREFLVILLALLVLAAAVFGIVKLVQSRHASKNAGLETTAVTAETVTKNQGTARVLTDEEKDMLRNSERYKKIMAHKEDYPQYLIDDLEMNPEILDFVADYLDMEPVGHGGLTAAEKKSAHPLFVQWDKRWGYSIYGENCMAVSACGPTAVAMVAYGLTRNAAIDPYAVAQYAMEKGYYVNGVGTAWTLLSEGAQHYGLAVTSQAKYTEDQLKEALSNGGMVILSVGKGDFTVHSGHFIVLYGYKNGKFQVNDPFSYTNSSKLWDYQTLMNQTKNTWIYYKADSEAAAAITTTTAAPTTTTTTAPVTSTTIAPITGTSAYTTTYVSSASGV
ncbi:MAG: C39 family peptidase [Clostridia bacterium]|nr:C39 family peptidase [Clostridia bacterium]